MKSNLIRQITSSHVDSREDQKYMEELYYLLNPRSRAPKEIKELRGLEYLRGKVINRKGVKK